MFTTVSSIGIIRFGGVEKVELKTDHTGAGKGYSFVTFADEDTAKSVLDFKEHQLKEQAIEVRVRFYQTLPVKKKVYVEI